MMRLRNLHIPGIRTGLLLLLFGLACVYLAPAGANYSPSSATPESNCARQQAASPVAATPEGTPVSADEMVSVTSDVTIRIDEDGFSPNIVESTNGHDLFITVKNQDTCPHKFKVDEYSIDVLVPAGESRKVAIHNPNLGDVEFYSDLPGDDQYRGRLTFYI